MTTATLDRAAAPPAHEPIVTARTYGFVAFLMLLNVFNILDRQLLPTFANDIKADLHLTNGQFGLLSWLRWSIIWPLLVIILGLALILSRRR